MKKLLSILLVLAVLLNVMAATAMAEEPETTAPEVLSEETETTSAESLTEEPDPAEQNSADLTEGSGSAVSETAGQTISGTCGENLTWLLDTDSGTLTISGTGAMENYMSYDAAPWYQNGIRWFIRNIVISEGVTTIGTNAFYNVSRLESIIIPEGVTTIGPSAFCACYELTTVTIPGSVTYIGSGVFYASALSTIIYTGEEKNWKNITISGDNEALISVARKTVHSGYTAETVGATCTDCGCIKYTCACGDSYKEVGENPEEAAGHHFVETSDGQWVCSVCGEESSAASPDNISDHTYEIWSSTAKSYLAETSDGKLLTIWSSGGCVLNVETRTTAGKLEGSRQLVLDYPVFGGFYEGTDAYYVVCGEDNLSSEDYRAVIRVIKYSKDWERQSAATLYGANTTEPFEAGSLRMTEADGKLYVYTCHKMYPTNGVCHQANLTMVADETTMKVVDSYYDVMNVSYGYVSHSFNQFIQTDGTFVYRADHGDAYPRAIHLSKCSVDGSITDVSCCESYEILGATGRNATGVSVGGMELSADNVLIAANSVDMTDESAYTPSGQRNIVLTVTDKNLTASKNVWLTGYTGDEGITVGTPFLVKLSDDLFMMLWEETADADGSVTVKQARIDGSGSILYTGTIDNCRLSDCQPVLMSDGYVTWFTRNTTGSVRMYRVSEHCADSGTVIKAATCGESGIRSCTCLICGKQFNDIIQTTEDHTCTSVTRRYTCTEYGYTTYTCSVCGYIYQADWTYPRHVYIGTVKRATCTEGGYTTYTCVGCGDTFVTDETDALGHSWKTDYTIDQAAGCTTEGSRSIHCSRCSAVKDSQVIPATGHTWNTGTVTKAAACTADGVKTYTCTACGETKTESIPATGVHTWNAGTVTKAATCTADGVKTYTCTGCGETKIETIPAAGAHTWNAGTVTKAAACTADGVRTYTCTTCGETKAESIPATGVHTWNAGTVTKAAACLADGEKTYTCTVCGKTKTEPVPAIGSPFKDVQDASEYFYDPVLWAVDKGIAYGTSDTTFSPEATCTRAQVVTFLYRAAGEPAVSSSNPFTDVQTDDYFYNAVLWAVEQGITYGTSDTTFSPEATCTRAQVVTFLYRAAGEPAVSSSNPFADVKPDDYFYDAVIWAVKKEITYGTSGTTFGSDDSCTRGQIACFLYRYMN